jgi:hypothetical protein
LCFRFNDLRIVRLGDHGDSLALAGFKSKCGKIAQLFILTADRLGWNRPLLSPDLLVPLSPMTGCGNRNDDEDVTQ